MEMGADALLINSAIALAGDPVAMARAMALACEAGRTALLAGRLPLRAEASPSSPRQGRLGS
jgi:thiazole synthase